MRRISLLALIVASTGVPWSACQAAGSFQTKAAFQTTVTPGAAPAVPKVSGPNGSAGDLIGGCGKGRIRDPRTHTCRGPADIR